MKFVNKTPKLQNKNYAEEEFEYEETLKPRCIPSYHSVVKKEQKKKTNK